MAKKLPSYHIRGASNDEIVHNLIARLQDLIVGTSYKLGVRYRLTVEDRQDLISSANYSISKVDWCETMKRNSDIMGYAKVLVLNSLREELRRIRSNGFRGVSMIIASLPPLEDNPPEIEAHFQEDQIISSQIAEVAAEILSPEEWETLRLTHGFDGGGSRTLDQVAREMKIPRREAAALLEQAMSKMREHLQLV